MSDILRGSRTLIIDDSLTIRAMVEELLAANTRCRALAVASDVPTARELLASFRPTLITLDLNLPGIDGLTFLDELRALPHSPVVVVVSSTTSYRASASREALKRGADACFDKSLIIADKTGFLQALDRAWTRQRLARQLRRQKRMAAPAIPAPVRPSLI